jgi:hypothetical protein
VIRDNSGTYSFNATLTSSWQRIVVSIPAAITNVQFTGGTGGCDATIYAAQLETGDIATDYIATTAAAVSVGPVANVPRLDYSGGASCPRLLLEPQRTNSVLWSEQINNAGWTNTNGATITTNIATAPDGYGGADGIQDTDGTSFKRVNQTISVSANSTATASVFVKKETTETNFGGLVLDFTGGSRMVFFVIMNAVNGTANNSTSSSGSVTIKIEDYGSYWRLIVTATDSGSNTNLLLQYFATISTSSTGGIDLGAGSVRTVWGFQLEIGAAYATSYIPTLGSASTRGSDGAGTSDVFGTTFTLDADFGLYWEGVINGNNTYPIFYSGGNYASGADFRSYLIYTSTQFNLFGVGEVLTATRTVALTAGTYYKILVKRVGSTIKWYVNGTEYANQGGTTTTTVKIRSLFGPTLGAPNHESVAQALIFQTTISDADAIALTA